MRACIPKAVFGPGRRGGQTAAPPSRLEGRGAGCTLIPRGWLIDKDPDVRALSGNAQCEEEEAYWASRPRPARCTHAQTMWLPWFGRGGRVHYSSRQCKAHSVRYCRRYSAYWPEDGIRMPASAARFLPLLCLVAPAAGDLRQQPAPCTIDGTPRSRPSRLTQAVWGLQWVNGRSPSICPRLSLGYG